MVSEGKADQVQNITDKEVCQSQEVTDLILEDMKNLATQNKFNGLERIKKIYMHEEPFTVENDMLTPSMKLKRNVSVKKFRQQINIMYGQ